MFLSDFQHGGRRCQNVKNNDKSKDIHPFFAQKASQPLQKKNTKSFEEKRADNRLKDAVPRRATVLKKNQPVYWDEAYKTGRPWLHFHMMFSKTFSHDV